MRALLALVAMATAILAVPSTKAAYKDLVRDLPGLGHPTSFNQYSGYLMGDDTTYIHYWFVEAQKGSAAPLLLWLNGGPGCSSMGGMLGELGPFIPSPDGETLSDNPQSWNTFANVLFLESPACVGYSYSTSNVDCNASDNSTSLLNYNALKHFFVKFPEFKENEFYISGESYGGIYLPTLAVRIVEGIKEAPMKFKGMAVGNGLSSWRLNDDSTIFFAYYHGLLGQTLWEKLLKFCCQGGVPSKDACNFHDNPSGACKSMVKAAHQITEEGGLDWYDLYSNCPTSSPTQRVANVSSPMLAGREHMLLRSHVRPGYQANLISEVKLDPRCTRDWGMTPYMNRPDVRGALHIHPALGKWDVCNDKVFATYQAQYLDMAAQYKTIKAAGVRSLVYNGDVDMACNYLGDQWFVEGLGYPVIEERRMWHSEGQVGGFVKRFELLDLLTIRGSGHMVPEDKPVPALKMIEAFVLGYPY